MVYPIVSLEGGGEIVSVRPQEPERLGSHTIARQDVKALVPVKCVICLLKVQENSVKDRLSHGCQLIGHLSLKGGCPSPTTRPENMEDVVVFYHCGQLSIDDTGCGLPQDLH